MGDDAGIRALVLIAEGSEEIEAVTVIDILRRAQVNVTVAAVGSSKDIVCSRGVRLRADDLLSEIPHPAEVFQVMCLPGGLKGAETFANNSMVQQLLKEFEAKGKAIAAMCASTTALLAAQVGKGLKVTSYPMFREKLQNFYQYQEDPVVTDGNFVTSRGPGTAMAWALAIIRVLLGSTAMHNVADSLILMFSPFNGIWNNPEMMSRDPRRSIGHLLMWDDAWLVSPFDRLYPIHTGWFK